MVTSVDPQGHVHANVDYRPHRDPGGYDNPVLLVPGTVGFPAAAAGTHFDADVMVIGSQRASSGTLPTLALYCLHASR